jgi:hypothetical protein
MSIFPSIRLINQFGLAGTLVFFVTWPPLNEANSGATIPFRLRQEMRLEALAYAAAYANSSTAVTAHLVMFLEFAGL